MLSEAISFQYATALRNKRLKTLNNLKITDSLSRDNNVTKIHETFWI